MAFGIPPLLNEVANAGNVVTLLVADAKLLFGGFNANPWGVFLKGAAALSPDSIVAVDFKNESHLVTYPLEEGSFQTYNKVSTPNMSHVRMTKGGTINEKSDFLKQLKKVAASLDLYDIVTPEETFLSVNVAGYDYSRSAVNGASLLTVDLSFMEVRVTAVAAYQNTKAPSGQNPVSTGTLQAAPTAPQYSTSGGT